MSRQQPGFMQPLVDTALIGTEGSATGEHERHIEIGEPHAESSFVREKRSDYAATHNERHGSWLRPSLIDDAV